MRIPRALAATAAALTLVLAGCSSDSAGESAAGGDGFNDADVDFASDMIQHHAQALQMVDLTMGRNLDPEVAQLTEDIRAAQAPEIELMVDWLEDRDQPIPETSRDHANAHGDSGDMDEDMPGMMSADDLAALESASEQEFQDLWLEMMVEHHEGAVSMAREVLDAGEDAEVQALAEDIVETQEAEISTMQNLREG